MSDEAAKIYRTDDSAVHVLPDGSAYFESARRPRARVTRSAAAVLIKAFRLARRILHFSVDDSKA